MAADVEPLPLAAPGAPAVAFDIGAARGLAAALNRLAEAVVAFDSTERLAAARAEVDWRGPARAELNVDRENLRRRLNAVVDQLRAQQAALIAARDAAANRQGALNTLHVLWLKDCQRASALGQPPPPYPSLPG